MFQAQRCGTKCLLALKKARNLEPGGTITVEVLIVIIGITTKDTNSTFFHSGLL